MSQKRRKGRSLGSQRENGELAKPKAQRKKEAIAELKKKEKAAEKEAKE